jgi:predicted peptidase
MKPLQNILVVSLLLSFLSSCSQNTVPETEENTNPTAVEEEVIEEIMEEETLPPLDTTDLEILPADTGGVHMAHPLGTTIAAFGHYMYTPANYENTEELYPLIVFLHGSGERGNSLNDPEELDKVLHHGPPKLIEAQQWNPAFPVLVASPQLAFDFWNADQIHLFISYLIDNYRINTKRIYLTGLSLGGGGCWFYVGNKGEDSYAAAMVPICASGHPSLVDNLLSTPVWAFHGAQDMVVRPFDQNGSVPMVQAINAENPPISAKVTIYPNIGHNSWGITYDNSGMGRESTEYNAFKMNIYDWFFHFKKE